MSSPSTGSTVITCSSSANAGPARGGGLAAAGLVLSLMLLAPEPMAAAAEADVEALAAELASLKKRLTELETLRERVAALEAELAAAKVIRDREDPPIAAAAEKRDLGTLSRGNEIPPTVVEEEVSEGISFGGALLLE